MVLVVGHQVVADGHVVAEVDPARLVDEHLGQNDVLDVEAQRDQEEPGLDGHVGDDALQEVEQAHQKK